MTQQHATPTLHDVAAHAGVSTATVSRCLNFPDKVAPSTRDRVQKAIAALGYSPNFGASVMAARRTKTIGAIIPTMDNAIFARGLQAFQEELRLHGYTMLVASTSYQPAQEEEQIRALVARGADALLLIGHARAPEIYQFLEAQGVPSLVTWAYDTNAPRPSVGFDNAAAMGMMAKAVLAQGHRQLALISASSASNDRAEERLAGIKSAMQANGLDPAALDVVETTYSIENGASALAELMTRPTPPTAVFCGNDVLAVGALRQAQDMQINVPKDVSIVGFDDIELAQVAYPPLTTVHVPHREMGRRAAQILVQALKDGQEMTSLALETNLVMRGTLGPAPAP
ncbi:LacI family DNA-binding transcriptional regulator [bacterium]|uniref:LacI family DNA-binding transcriptional regulator n=1 Tax=Yoonia sp. TaxID=2212373 RepID=UPI00236E8FD0|nr:LacI family DNA-binding transcriptional regulator [Yoonia sp.]MDB4246047.1 LacI family DNA-binding transcriptional regulator [bacterium]